MTGNYDFSTLGFAGIYTDPEIINIPAESVNIESLSGLTIAADVYLSGAGYQICIRLTGICVNDFNYNPEQLVTRVITRLNYFLV